MENVILEPEFYVDFDGTVRSGAITIGGGKIIALGEPPEKGGKKIRLANQVVLPGFVNCHSHVFQRALRGLVEGHGKPFARDNFWTWREKMYSLANNLTEDTLLTLATLTYWEMLEAGFTHVGEFHYLHHDVGNKPFTDPLTMSRALSLAAINTGINLRLLECAYHQQSFFKPLLNEQKRFGFSNVKDFLAFVRSAKDSLNQKSVDVGIAIHSVRAVPASWFSAINEFAQSFAMPLHIHVSEQPEENDACLDATGCSPIALLYKEQLLAPHLTLVHATHLINDDLSLLAKTRPNICICPSTEKNLGDGMVELSPLLQQNIPICLGTDQHVRLDPFCEARSLEEMERLRLLRRGIVNDDGCHLYQPLLKCLTTSGMQSLYPTYDHKTMLGKDANLIALTLPPEYLWHGPEIALNAIMLSYNTSKITHVMTNGAFILHDGELISTEKSYLIKEINRFFKRSFYP